MSLDILKLPDDVAELQNIIVSLVDKQAVIEAEKQDLEEYVRQLKSALFGRKSEKIPPNEGK